MTRQEVVKLLKILTDTYPYVQNKIGDPQEMAGIWYMLFMNDDAGKVFKAARYHMNTKKFFPTPAELREVMTRADLLYSEKVPTIEEPSVPKLEDGHMTDDEYIEYIIQFLGIGCEAIDS